MTKLIRKTLSDSIAEILISSGYGIATCANPLDLCKETLKYIETTNEENFINSVLNDTKKIDIQSLDAVKSLKRLYKSMQVIAKATTVEKIERFKKLTVNGICYQDEISDSEYDLFVNIADELSDTEFLILYKINQIENEHIGETFNNPISDTIGKTLLSDLNMDLELFTSYIFRLKAKGLIVDAHGHWMSMDTPFFIGIVDGKTSVLCKNLINSIEKTL